MTATAKSPRTATALMARMNSLRQDPWRRAYRFGGNDARWALIGAVGARAAFSHRPGRARLRWTRVVIWAALSKAIGPTALGGTSAWSPTTCIAFTSAKRGSHADLLDPVRARAGRHPPRNSPRRRRARRDRRPRSRRPGAPVPDSA